MSWGVYRKTLAFYLVFMAMYGLYRTWPVFPLSLICGTTESVFQHFKAGFFAYLIASLIEFGFERRNIQNRESFLFSRLTATTFLPWFIFILWYIAPALYGKWPHVALEIIYANVVTIITGVFVATLERGLEQIAYTRQLEAVILILFLASIGLYLIFTWKLPWADVFVEPNWR